MSIITRWTWVRREGLPYQSFSKFIQRRIHNRGQKETFFLKIRIQLLRHKVPDARNKSYNFFVIAEEYFLLLYSLTGTMPNSALVQNTSSACSRLVVVTMSCR